MTPPVGFHGGADSFEDAGPAEDAGEEVEVVAERGPAVLGVLEVGAAPFVHGVGQVEEVVECGFEGHRFGFEVVEQVLEQLVEDLAGAAVGVVGVEGGEGAEGGEGVGGSQPPLERLGLELAPRGGGPQLAVLLAEGAGGGGPADGEGQLGELGGGLGLERLVADRLVEPVVGPEQADEGSCVGQGGLALLGELAALAVEVGQGGEAGQNRRPAGGLDDSGRGVSRLRSPLRSGSGQVYRTEHGERGVDGLGVVEGYAAGLEEAEHRLGRS